MGREDLAIVFTVQYGLASYSGLFWEKQISQVMRLSLCFIFVLEIQSVVFPLQSFSFPGFVPAGKVSPPIQNNAILMSEYFTCHG